MIYEDERSVDEMVDDILGPGEGEGVREPETPSANGKRVFLNRCKDCRTTFESPYVGGKYCPACKRKRISEGQKARQARERQERAAGAAANDRQVKTRTEEPQKGAETMEKEAETIQKAWNELDAPESEANEARQDPAAAAERDKNTLILDIYNTVRNLARAVGLDPGKTMEALWEIDSILGAVSRV